ncbi:MAG: pyruvate kinase [Caldilineaceae bacterium]|nr:pyruvate kinase [Caldilineaceae bacterium]MBP8107565.1 pyruvate kinase [Caldilineaceae bacterium]MBP8124871.1 pyruvate kinase [Caldilineaceae bacterium]MBP9074602.1 pyruvate kinase [Caldilineaceae bacterium]
MLRTKIVCTIGPAVREPDVLANLILAGMDVARLNFSHGTHDYHRESIRLIRSISQELRKPVAILADLQGPKLRVGKMQPGGVPLKPGDDLILTTEDIVGGPGRVPIQYADLPRQVEKGERILIDDGLLEIEVVSASKTEIMTKVIIGGILNDNKGMNLPSASLDIPALTVKDREDVRFALEHQVDWIALSFVRSDVEVLELKALAKERATFGRITPIIAKIEKPEAVDNIAQIVKAADGIMVARGDLGIETSPEAVPMAQKMIIKTCNEAGKPVITATQMLDSMVRNPRPTRAEASDVANAVLDGTDALMLSNETATGAYPVLAVQTMVKIAEEAERVRQMKQNDMLDLHKKVVNIAGAVCHATVQTAKDVQAAAILAPTASGFTAGMLARFRPSVPIIAVTPSPMAQRRLCLYWGVTALLSKRLNSTDEVVEDAIRVARENGFVKEGETVVITAGMVSGVPRMTNLLTVRTVERILAEGTGLGQRKVAGRLVHLKMPVDPKKVNVGPDDIIFADYTDGSCVQLLQRVGGLITREGDIDSFSAMAAIELGVPAVIGVQGKLEDLVDGRRVILDAKQGKVYEWVK